ncbi:MAG: DUF3090 domain-containing protein [Chloroflexota bacterium]|nr:DUF3090 domain-containing protein [Chloroflexota bacterium]
MSTELGTVHTLGVEAIGQPGQRRFRLFVRSSRGTALLWMEKEYLNNLSLTIDRALAQLTEGKLLRTEAQVGDSPTPSALPENFPRTPDYEFQVGQIGLSYEEDRNLFVLIATPLEIIMEQGDVPAARLLEEEALSFLFTQQQAYDLTRTINAIVTSGRPICPLCHTPLDGGPHACVKQNGHRQIVRVEEGDEEEE